jgi:hypothetical protein
MLRGSMTYDMMFATNKHICIARDQGSVPSWGSAMSKLLRHVEKEMVHAHRGRKNQRPYKQRVLFVVWCVYRPPHQLR